MEEASYKVIRYAYRDLPESYKPMIFSKWLRSLRYGNDYFKLINQEAYFKAYHVYLERLLSHPEAVVKMAVLADDYDVVLGFSVSRGQVLDYVHVQRDYRRKGIGSLLINSSMIVITHITRQGMSFWNNRLKDAILDPFV